jgi:Spy/CpxP family protein refolding chaperone
MKNRTTLSIVLVAIALFGGGAIIATISEDHNFTSDYAGEQLREIKSLSAEDIAELKSGGGWGFAKPAELNGVPGPAHLLEMKAEISLSDNQIASIEELHTKMLSEAIPLGEKYVDAEKILNQMFANDTYNDENLLSQIDEIESIRGQLRYVHLSKHLETVKILTDEQISKYNNLRGYGEGNVCDNIPEGHNAELFKKHNDCE